ncbi:ABC transporter ATP-binding protein/permease [Breznakia pachnodae]|uniref:ABC transport system permease protein n=1 Tax=Breznakia pachnodae TaxID=265178 RepID=A0ABU0DXI4_9FIRM|nr:ABC transporter ATP-binding protein/permease [Breznakia pachnodae]MDQ0359352.1 putative ABC transport system permease protein [Breznakia pachnodae]
MLKLTSIRKSYKTGDFIQHALHDVSLSFSKNEFVAVLGESGSGKTTLLNIIGGLNRYDDGDLIINNKSTKKFKDKDWDAYRNNCIGFVFQNYNLIPHISVLSNIEMGMTLSGVSPSIRKQRALDALEQVGLKKHAHKKPNQLSGGQMQRVTIARALANDPDIILADEPTGALDSETSVQIMELIQQIAKDKLVIMVTHNPQLATTYANRIIHLKDGNVIKDSGSKSQSESSKTTLEIKKTAMSYLSALKLSFHNLCTKKGRTFLTSFASSIGIIGIALILALSNGFQREIEVFEKDSLSQMPITITSQAMQLDFSSLGGSENDNETYPENERIIASQNSHESMFHTNNITSEYLEYIENINQKDLNAISYQYSAVFNILVKTTDNTIEKVDNTQRHGTWDVLPNSINDTNIIEDTYDVLSGTIKEDEPGIIVVVGSSNDLSDITLQQLGIHSEEGASYTFDDILNSELKLITNDNYYIEYNGNFVPDNQLESLFNNQNSISLPVQAIIRAKEGKELLSSSNSIYYTEAVSTLLIETNKDSKIVIAQKESSYNVLTGEIFNENSSSTKDDVIGYLGGDATPSSISIYPKDFDSKTRVTEYLDAYNEGKETVDQIVYTDMAALITSLSGDIMNAITYVLIAFSAISLIVSSFMIGIIIYISVLERTKEIGILRALGARKKDIRRVFNAETLIVGLFSGCLGIGITQLLILPINMIIERVSGLGNVANLHPLHALILVMISLVLTVIGGYIPSRMAAKKDPVDALRSE